MQETLGFCCDKRIWSSINECNKMLPKTMFAIVKKHNNGRIHHIDINGRVSLSFHIRKNDRERIKYFFQQLNHLVNESGKTSEELLIRVCKKGQKIRVINFLNLVETAKTINEFFVIDNNLKLGVLHTERNLVEVYNHAKYFSSIPPISNESLEKIISRIDRLLRGLKALHKINNSKSQGTPTK